MWIFILVEVSVFDYFWPQNQTIQIELKIDEVNRMLQILNVKTMLKQISKSNHGNNKESNHPANTNLLFSHKNWTKIACFN